MVEEVLQLGLSARRGAPRRFKVKPLNPGIKPAFRDLSMNQLYDQIESEDFSRFPGLVTVNPLVGR